MGNHDTKWVMPALGSAEEDRGRWDLTCSCRNVPPVVQAWVSHWADNMHTQVCFINSFNKNQPHLVKKNKSCPMVEHKKYVPVLTSNYSKRER